MNNVTHRAVGRRNIGSGNGNAAAAMQVCNPQSAIRNPQLREFAIRNPQFEGPGGRRGEAGLTLVELIVAFTILLVLTTAALPLARVQVKRERERELRYAVKQLRDAIDRYKDFADRGQILTKIESENYPPDLETLVKGVNITGGKPDQKMKFLRKIPVDPMTNSADWGLRSTKDDPTSTSFGGQNVFDVYSKSLDTAMDGSKYSEW